MLSRFLDRSLGKWISHRSYFYTKPKKCISSITEFEWTKTEEGLYIVNWHNKVQKSEGQMSLHPSEDNKKLIRNSGYFTDKATESVVKIQTLDLFKTKTVYDGNEFTETITFLNNNLRVRQTIARKIKDDEVFLIGNYTEYKKDTINEN